MAMGQSRSRNTTSTSASSNCTSPRNISWPHQRSCDGTPWGSSGIEIRIPLHQDTGWCCQLRDANLFRAACQGSLDHHRKLRSRRPGWHVRHFTLHEDPQGYQRHPKGGDIPRSQVRSERKCPEGCSRHWVDYCIRTAHCWICPQNRVPKECTILFQSCHGWNHLIVFYGRTKQVTGS